MLQTQTVDGATLELLKDLLAMPELKYTSHDIFHLVRSLTYFVDAEKQK